MLIVCVNVLEGDFVSRGHIHQSINGHHHETRCPDQTNLGGDHSGSSCSSSYMYCIILFSWFLYSALIYLYTALHCPNLRRALMPVLLSGHLSHHSRKTQISVVDSHWTGIEAVFTGLTASGVDGVSYAVTDSSTELDRLL